MNRENFGEESKNEHFEMDFEIAAGPLDLFNEGEESKEMPAIQEIIS